MACMSQDCIRRKLMALFRHLLNSYKSKVVVGSIYGKGCAQLLLSRLEIKPNKNITAITNLYVV